jgi:hypothetical protein
MSNQSFTAEQWKQFANGIAFNLRQYLTAMEGYAELAAKEVGRTEPVASYIDQVRDAAKRCKEVVQILGDRVRDS